MSVEKHDSIVCDCCSGYNISPVICIDCIKKWIRDAKEKDIDYVGKYLEAKLDSFND